MLAVVSVLIALRSLVRSRAALHLEVLALKHQLQVLERSRRPRLRLTAADRLLWVWFSRIWTEWRPALVIVQPRSVPLLSRGECFERAPPSGRSRVVVQKAAESRTSTDATSTLARDGFKQFIAEALMIALAMVVLDVLGDRAPEMALAKRYDPIEAFLLNRPHETFGVGIGVSRQLHRRRTVRRKSFELPIPSIRCGAGPSS
jgi:hypothetical protein